MKKEVEEEERERLDIEKDKKKNFFILFRRNDHYILTRGTLQSLTKEFKINLHTVPLVTSSFVPSKDVVHNDRWSAHVLHLTLSGKLY